MSFNLTNQKINKAEEYSRIKFTNFVLKQNPELTIRLMGIESPYDFEIIKDNNLFIYEHKHRDISINAPYIINDGPLLDAYKFKKLIEIVKNDETNSTKAIYSSTYIEDNVMMEIYLNNLPIEEILRDIHEAEVYLTNLVLQGYELNIYNGIDEYFKRNNINKKINKWCKIDWLPDVYVNNTKKWKVAVIFPYPNEENFIKYNNGKKYGRISKC